MPRYPYVCARQHRCDETRPIEERDWPGTCPVCSGLLARDEGAQYRSITIASVPLNFYTQWGDVYDCSPREMAQRRDIERYDPSMAHKPEIPRTRFDLPRGIEDVDTLIKYIAPVDGQRETDKIARLTAEPVAGETAYA